MNYIFNFPDIGEGLEEGTVLEWYVKVGDKVKVGDPLVKMETDKVAADIPSPKNGILVATFGKVGETIKVGNPLVEILIEGASVNAVKEEEKAATVVGTMELADENSVLPSSNEGREEEKTDNSTLHRKILATPVARALAKELGIDINKIDGSGPSGRVIRQDIETFHAQQNQQPDDLLVQQHQDLSDVTYEPLTQIRKTIAKNMHSSKHNAAHMSIFEEVEVSELIKIRQKYKVKYAERGVKLTYLSFVVKATVLALKEHRQLNSQLDLDNDRMIFHNRYNIALAVDTEVGLVVPVIRNADQLSIFEIAQRIDEISEKARNRQLTIEDMRGGTFTITNFGSIGGIFGTPVINYPQAAILGIGRILKTPIVKNDEVVVGNVLPLSLSVDHRIVDGAEITRFVNKVAEYLADPIGLLMV
jgi:pyruvate dehydrogenase E2 component (dihydrolipoamide acetyltransferase)